MVTTIVVMALLAAPPEGAAAKTEGQHLKLAAPGFSGVNVDDKVASFFSDHLAQQLALRGIVVVTASEIGAMIGYERQKHLLGCNDGSSCIAELGNALGVDGIITGSIAKFGNTVQANIKVLKSTDGSAMGVISRKVQGEEAMLEELTNAASDLAPQLIKKLGRVPAVATTGMSETAAKRVYPQNALTISPVGIALGFYGLEYEREVVTGLTVYVAPQYVKHFLVGNIDAFEVSGGSRYYLSGQPFVGLFVGLQAGFGTGSGSFTSSGGTTNFVGPSLNLSGTFGFGALIAGRVPLSLGIGVGWNFIGGYAVTYLGNVLVGLRLNAGFAF